MNSNNLLKVLIGGAAGAIVYWVMKKTDEEDAQYRETLQQERNNAGPQANRRLRTLSNSSLLENQNVAGNLIDLLQNTLIEYILGQDTHHVITIDSTATLDYALMRMNESNVSSLPIVDLQNKRYIGMLSIIDVCSYLGAHNPTEVAPNTSVAEVLKYNREPFLPLYVNSPIQLLIHIMTQKVPQVAIMSNDTIVVDIVSRLNVIKFIYENIEALGSKSNYSIASLNLMSKSVCTIKSSEKVIDAINKLNSDQVTELAVVHPETGLLVGSFSASDLRKLSIYTFNRCYEPISSFIKLREDIDENQLINPSSTLRSTIRKMVEHEAPILWVVDSQMKPISCVSQLKQKDRFLSLALDLIELELLDFFCFSIYTFKSYATTTTNYQEGSCCLSKYLYSNSNNITIYE
ncbi:hypothetical protein PPL_10362 [Heterostelium album PN500]|uniref:CBS domain-containing protein n=1 Tax=Heterostelium pallidum (strain ATCC 26659 / Pp 5 / PN500) TaxID=670386 RepID=D3BQ42_HETP5|nr:hypothetical protein PPL_10362 [Heterostelium album PN500]EFA76593.1 hypothetical protein PPL_10362 [Heterostelium album PN500]|eukprot:XP_020428725.1 hypothetical protein PPL_10362 [Heterostelium album PN500]